MVDIYEAQSLKKRVIGEVLHRNDLGEVVEKWCPDCQDWRSITIFTADNSPGKVARGDFWQTYCNPCQRARRKLWYWNLPNRIETRNQYKLKENVEESVRRRRELRWSLRLEMIAAYGGKCTCCRELAPEFLTLEHLNGGGRAEVRKFHKPSWLYRELKRRGWPPSYTVLCFNCNSAKGHFGICPHQRAVKVEVCHG